jgi:hypothetical protein
VNSPEDGPVGPKHVEIRRYMNKIEIMTSVGFSFPLAIISSKPPNYIQFLRYHYSYVLPHASRTLLTRTGTSGSYCNSPIGPVESR